MKYKLHSIGLLTLTFMLTACSLVTTDSNWRPDMENANFGRYPVNYPKLLQKWGKDYFDEEKINYLSISSPREEYLVKDSENKEVIYGYSVCANISGIKSKGAYKPFKKYWFFIYNDDIIEHRDIDYSYNEVIYRDHKVNCSDPI